MLVLVIAGVPCSSFAPPQPIAALAPIEIWASGFGSIRGVAADSDGDIYVADRQAGTVTRIGQDHTAGVVATGLQRPVGLAFDLDRRLLIAEERAGRVVRVERSGSRTPIFTGIKQPRWLAVAGDGTLYISARRSTRVIDAEPDDESAEPELILALAVARPLRVFVDGLRQLQGLVVAEGAVWAATTGARDAPDVRGAILHIPILADGSAGSITHVGPSDNLKRPTGLARDGRGALYASTKALAVNEDPGKGTIAKLHADQASTVFASSLDDPQGLAFDSSGNLYVGDGRSGRVIRFRAPAPPTVSPLPRFTNRSPITVIGSTEPNARVAVFVNGAVTPSVVADAVGAFALPVDLTPNADTTLEVLATTHRGDGLTSAVTAAAVTHDGVPPTVVFGAPAPGAFVRQGVSVQVQANDAGSQVAMMVARAGTQSLGGTLSPALPAGSTTAFAVWNTTTSADGVQALLATAFDRAGNSTTVTRTVIVDNTAPDTTIVDGPGATTSATSVAFVFSGSDNLTPVPNLQFAWRLDDGPWSSFSMAKSATLGGLAPGSHRFEVKARDQAGNEDPTPAARSFTVASARVTITEPANGATVPAGLLLVRGTLDAASQEAGITVNGFPGALQGGAFAAMIPVTFDTVTLTAVAATADSGSPTQTISIHVTSAAEPNGQLIAVPQSGIAPLVVRFSLSGGSARRLSADFDGDGAIDFTGPTLDSQPFTYTQPGLYFPAITVIDSQGTQFMTRAIVQVYDRTGIDILLRMKWNGMKAALISKDVTAAVAFFAETQQDRHRTLFSALDAQIAEIARDMQDIQLIYVSDNRAKYRLRRTQLYGERLVTITYYAYFVQDGSGLWSIEGF